MHRLPKSISESLAGISASGRGAARLVGCVAKLLEAQAVCADLATAIAAYREAARSLGIFSEARSGQRIHDAWSKLEGYFFEPLRSFEPAFSDGETAEAPEGFEALASRWERTAAEFRALLEEEKALDRLLEDSPAGAHVGYGTRSRLLLFDRRAERVQVVLGLLERDLLQAARRGLEAAKRELAGGKGGGGSS